LYIQAVFVLNNRLNITTLGFASLRSTKPGIPNKIKKLKKKKVITQLLVG